MQLTENETQLIQILRELKPYEIVEIKKDKDGKPDFYIIKRETKVFFTKIYTTLDR